MSGGSRRALLVAALGFAGCDATLPEIEMLRSWLSSWRGVGLVTVGMARHGYDLSLTRYADLGWRAIFYVSGREHSPTGASGSAFETTPYRAVQTAAWETLARA